MPKNRLEAFSDGVLAIIITIMVLAMEAPEGKSWRDLGAILAPLFRRSLATLSAIPMLGFTG